jgi:hypothetical protein
MRLATLLLTSAAFFAAAPAFAAEPQMDAAAAPAADTAAGAEGEAIVVYGTGRSR